MSAGHVSSGRTAITASWLDPESNQTSRMSFSRSKAVDPHLAHARPGGTNSPVGRSYHASAPYTSNTFAVRSTMSTLVTASPHVAHDSAAIGTPQTRCREMHQSGRFATML